MVVNSFALLSDFNGMHTKISPIFLTYMLLTRNFVSAITFSLIKEIYLSIPECGRK